MFYTAVLTLMFVMLLVAVYPTKRIAEKIGVKTRENAAIFVPYGAAFVCLAYWWIH